MLLPKLEITFLSLAFLCSLVLAGGNKGYDDECSVGAGILSAVGAKDDGGTCNTDKHLICVPGVGKCKCMPNYAYEKGWLGVEAFFGGCKVRALFPCDADKDTCVSNSNCNNICSCKDGYSPSIDGHCSNASAKLDRLLPIYFLGLVLSYFVAA